MCQFAPEHRLSHMTPPTDPNPYASPCSHEAKAFGTPHLVILIYVSMHFCIVLLCGSLAVIEVFQLVVSATSRDCLTRIVGWTSYEVVIGPFISGVFVVLTRRRARAIKMSAVIDVVLSVSHVVVIMPLIE